MTVQKRRKSKNILEVPKAGVQLGYLVNEFVEECGGKDALQGLTTADVLKKFILPKTEESKVSYCEVLKSEGKKAYGEEAKVFISHARQCDFLKVVEALNWHFREQDPHS